MRTMEILLFRLFLRPAIHPWRPRRIANKVYGMNPSKEDNDAKQDTDSEKPRLVPADLDIPDGNEEKHEEIDLPPAMPPKV